MIADSHSLNDQISSEAAEWLVEFRSGDIDGTGRRNFDAWLRASPEHIRAFIEMAAVWHEGGAIDPRRELDVEAITARARSERNIARLTPGEGFEAPVSMPSDSASADTMPAAAGSARSRGLRPSWWAAAASMLVAVLAIAWMWDAGLLSSPTYATAVRVRRSIVLPDGSKVLLDSRSVLRVAYTIAARKVELLRGQALFHVIGNPRRPFLVQAGHTVVRDVGTVFDVNRLRDGTVVTVVEGRVAVSAPSPARAGATATAPGHRSRDDAAPAAARGQALVRPVYLSAGEELELEAGRSPARPVHVDTSSATAWTHGEVVLKSATLPEVAQVFTRYSPRRIVAQDLGRKPLRLSGVFSTNPDFLIRYLRSRPDVTVRETDSKLDIVRNPE